MIDRLTLLTALRFVSLASGVRDVRSYLNGVLFELHPDRLELVATNGHCMAHATISGALGVKGQFLVSAGQIKEAMRILQACKLRGQVAIRPSGSCLDIEPVDPNHWAGLTFPPLAHSFPDWRRVAPMGPPHPAPAGFSIDGYKAGRFIAEAAKLDGSGGHNARCDFYGFAPGGLKITPEKLSTAYPGLSDVWAYVLFRRGKVQL